MAGRRPRIYDAVYGYVELEEYEFKLINTAIFQRLHWIKQLGPLHTVFPSAQHSRFSHTIGVFSIVKKMIQHLTELHELKPEYGYSFEEGEDKILRLAALLHDIGHVPLSHVGERVLAESGGKGLPAEEDRSGNSRTVDLLTGDGSGGEEAWWGLFPDTEYRGTSTNLHERLSAEIALNEEDVDRVLSQVEGWKQGNVRERVKKRIAQIIVGKNLADVPTTLMHSELDADRLDYLLRDSFFTGVGYGRVDLDYIISRLVVYRHKDSSDLCLEGKGLHTAEHYILGRFFLQTQVILNRKVRFMDLLFEDVMRYMLRESAPDHLRLMNLREFRDHIQRATGRDKRHHLHRIYSFTDAEVFTKMRRLHEELGRKQEEGTAGEEELYINDCIKTIMDGDVPEPVFHTCQRLIDRVKEADYERRLQAKAERIVQKLAKKLSIYSLRIKTSLKAHNVMKYGTRFVGPRADEADELNRRPVKSGADEEANQEAVKIIYQDPEGKDHKLYAAESNATILKGLTDKALLLFNCYYVPVKGRYDDAEAKREQIREAFAEFRMKEFMPERSCESDAHEHRQN